MKKNVSIFMFLLISFISNSQDMKIKWLDNSGREFSISTISNSFTYSMISGDRIEYEPSYSDNSGKIKSVGGLRIEYEPSYSSNSGKIRSTSGRVN